jgi:antitoxin component of RelBE/YafQ-DinJ toxin-antitoxin module
MENIVSAAKTDVFRVRINPEIKQELESVYAKNGLTLTDAINVFFQQSLNAGGFPCDRGQRGDHQGKGALPADKAVAGSAGRPGFLLRG